MTHDNLFQEVEEDLERQKLEALWKRYGGLVIAGAVVVVLATGAFTTWHSWRTKQEQTATAGLIAILNQAKPDPDKQIAALESFAQKNSRETQAVFAQLHAAAMAAKQGDTKKAVQLYDAVAADTKTDPAFRQFADLLSVQTQMDSGDPAALSLRLQPLTASDAAWRFTAMEYQGYLALRANDKNKARQIFTALSQDASAPRTLSMRAGDMLRLLAE
jgi:hypothetical protein